MAKTPAKKTTKKVAPKSVTPRAKKVSSLSIDKIAKQSLDRLEKLDLASQLQSEIKWCIGSYSYDKNPKGLYETTTKALKVLTEARERNPKAVPAKLITDINKALKQA